MVIRLLIAALLIVFAASPSWAILRGSGGASGVTIADDFNRADSADLGASWTEAGSGYFSIVSNTLAMVAPATFGVAAHNTALTGDSGYLKIDFGDPATTNYPGIIFRYTNSTSPFYGMVFLRASCEFIWQRYPNVASGQTNLETSADLGTCTSGTLGVTWTGTGTSTVVNIWLNPTADAPGSASLWDGAAPGHSFTADPASPVNTGTLVGVKSLNASIFDNFKAGDL